MAWQYLAWHEKTTPPGGRTIQGLMWTAGIWALVLAAVFVLPSARQERWDGPALRRQLALVLVLLGTHSIAAASTTEDTLADPLVIERILRGGLTTVALVLIYPDLLRIASRAHRLRWGVASSALIVYVGVGALSSAYSAAPIVTVGKVYELGVALAVIVAIAQSTDAEREVRRVIRLVVVLEAALLAVGIVGYVAMPQLFAEVQNRPGFLLPATMVSPYGHSNGLSASGALVAAYALAAYFRRGEDDPGGRWLALAGVGTVGVVLTSGRQGLIILVLSLAVLLWAHRRILLAALLPAAGVGLMFVADSLWAIVARGQTTEQLATLTTRTVWWGSAIDAFATQPVTGYGFGVGGRFVALQGAGFDVGSVHNGYLEALVGVGMLGFIPLTIAIWQVAKWAYRNIVIYKNTLPAIVVVPLLIHTFVSLGFGAWLQPDFVVFAAVAALADLERRRHRGMARHIRGVGDAPPPGISVPRF